MPLSEWKEYKFNDLGEIKTGKTPPNKAGDIWGNSIQFITPTDISNQKYITQTNRGLSDLGLEKVKTCFLPKDSIIVTCIGSDMGKVVINKEDCITNQQINSIIIDKNKFSADYIYYNFSTRKDEFFNLASGGSTMPILNKTAFSNLKIKIPQLSEQQAIADILGSLDDKIELNRQMNKTLEDMAQAIFKSWFVDFDPVKAKAEGRTIEGLSQEILDLFPDRFEDSELGDIPKGWSIKKTSELFEVKDGTHASPKQTETGHYLITSKHIIGDTIDYKTAKLISEKDFEEVNKRSKVDKLDILITMIGTVGNPFIVQQDNIDFAIKNIGLFKTSQNQELAYYLYLLLKSKNMQDYIISKLAGTTQAYITLGELRSLPILYDKKIINKFNEITQSIFIKIQANNEETQTLSTMRDTILPKLISGELRIPDVEKLVEELV